MADLFRHEQIDVVAAAEARGFIFAAPVALELNAALVPIRKPGKLPFTTQSLSYDLEYGSDALEIHADAIAPGAGAHGRRSAGHRRHDRRLLPFGGKGGRGGGRLRFLIELVGFEGGRTNRQAQVRQPHPIRLSGHAARLSR